VQALFPLVLFGSIGLFVLLGVLSMLTHRNLHDQIGQGGFFTGEDTFGGAGAGGSGTALGSGGAGGAGGMGGSASPWGDQGAGQSGSGRERELEIRQLLEARSERLVRRGHAPLDIDAELARLEAGSGAEGPGSHDPGLTAEVRQLVLARNERRRRRGLDALDVEVEVQRTLAELDA
jgi:hypothetical protein